MIAFAGSQAKVDFLKSLGIESAHNYKTEELSEVLGKEAPNGVNCYFDNVNSFYSICCKVEKKIYIFNAWT